MDDPIFIRNAPMIDIGDKQIVKREAVASGYIKLKRTTLKAIGEGSVKKGDVKEVSRVAGVLGAKMTPQLIPHCHPLPLESVLPSIEIETEGIRVTCRVTARYKTGVEMEALSCVNSMLLTVWDMVKYLEKDEKGQYTSTEISEVRVIRKEKGR